MCACVCLYLCMFERPCVGTMKTKQQVVDVNESAGKRNDGKEELKKKAPPWHPTAAAVSDETRQN